MRNRKNPVCSPPVALFALYLDFAKLRAQTLSLNLLFAKPVTLAQSPQTLSPNRPNTLHPPSSSTTTTSIFSYRPLLVLVIPLQIAG